MHVDSQQIGWEDTYSSAVPLCGRGKMPSLPSARFIPLHCGHVQAWCTEKHKILHAVLFFNAARCKAIHCLAIELYKISMQHLKVPRKRANVAIRRAQRIIIARISVWLHMCSSWCEPMLRMRTAPTTLIYSPQRFPWRLIHNTCVLCNITMQSASFPIAPVHTTVLWWWKKQYCWIPTLLCKQNVFCDI